jgi:hypothetical protein
LDRRVLGINAIERNQMQTLTPMTTAGYRDGATEAVNNESNSPGVSWPAIIGGGFVTAALSLILLALGAGLGLSSVSLWPNEGVSSSTIGTGAIIWLILMQILSSSMGGYLSGRLRTKWASIHTDEVYFRDTAHGFLAWSVSFVVTAAFLASAAASMAGVTLSGGKAPDSQAGRFEPNDYYVDTLLRANGARSDADSPAVRNEVGHILANTLRQRDMSTADKSYLGQLIAARTGLSRADADSRVSDVFGRAQQAADAARKAVAHSLLWIFLALLIGAFCASVAATIGGRQRDRVVSI